MECAVCMIFPIHCKAGRNLEANEGVCINLKSVVSLSIIINIIYKIENLFKMLFPRLSCTCIYIQANILLC